MFLLNNWRRLWINMVSHKPAFPAWRVQTRAGGTCTTSSCTYIFVKESDPFTFVPFRLSVSFILHLSPSFYIFLSLLLFCMTDTLLAKIYAGIRIRMLRYIIVMVMCMCVWRRCQCLARDKRSVPTINTLYFSLYRIIARFLCNAMCIF